MKSRSQRVFRKLLALTESVIYQHIMSQTLVPVKVEIAGICIEIRSPRPDLVREYAGEFISTVSPDVIFVLGHDSDLKSIDGIGYLNFHINGKLVSITPSTISCIDTKKREVFALVGRSEYFLEPAIELLIRHYSLLFPGDSLLAIHSAGIVCDNWAYLFTGKPGAGKSTIARILSDKIILSDEIVIVKSVDGKYKAFGMPICGEVKGQNANAEIVGYFSLKQDVHAWAKPLPMVTFLHHIADNLIGQELTPKIFHECCNFVQNIPGYELHFLPDKSLWEVVKNVT